MERAWRIQWCGRRWRALPSDRVGDLDASFELSGDEWAERRSSACGGMRPRRRGACCRAT